MAVNDVTGVQYTRKPKRRHLRSAKSASWPLSAAGVQVGFKTVIKPDIVLNVQDALSINFTLPVGAVFEVVTVEGGAPIGKHRIGSGEHG